MDEKQSAFGWPLFHDIDQWIKQLLDRFYDTIPQLKLFNANLNKITATNMSDWIDTASSLWQLELSFCLLDNRYA